MDEAAPITWLIAKINAVVSSGAATAAGTIASTIAPLVSVCFGIYIILICVNYMRGSETEPVIDFGMRMAGFAIVIGLGLNASNYTTIVIPIITGLGDDLASAVSGGSVTAGTLDELALHYLTIIGDGFESAERLFFPTNITQLIIIGLKSIIIAFGLVPFLVAAALALIVASVGSLLVAMVGPLFFAFLIFPVTRQYFSAWVNTALSYALIPLFVAVVALISVGISKEMLSAGGTLSGTSFKSVFLASVGNLTLLFLVRQVSSLAASLSAGGINAAMPGSIGTLASAIRSGAAGSLREAKAARNFGRGAAQSLQARREAAANRTNTIARRAG